AADEGPVETWMTWMIAYHVTMRAALVVKARGSPTREIDDAAIATAKIEVARRIDLSIDDAFVRSVANTPHRRLNRAVFERLAEDFGSTPDTIWNALFPARRSGRY